MPDLDLRLAVLFVWGGGTVGAYGSVLWRRMHAFQVHHDTRSRRELLAGFGLFLTALCAALAVVVVLFGEAGTGIRGWFSAIALGAFFGAGLVMASEVRSEDHHE